MDYARKIGKEEKKPMWGKSSVSVSTLQDGLLSRDKLFTEDHRLHNWKKWLDDRAKQSQRIKTRTGRDQAEQVLHSCEKVRPLIETKNLMEYGNEPIPLTFDKYRGNPEFWKVPFSLPRRGCVPEVFAVPTKKQLNIKPELLYAGTPDVIKKEKKLSGLKLSEPRWKKSKYLKQRRQELAEEIKTVIEKEPEIEELVIEGKGFRDEKEDTRIPLITIASPEELVKESEKSDDDSDYAIVLKIQEREIIHRKNAFKSVESGVNPLIWELKFHGTVDERREEEIVLENKGNCTIVYQWRNVFIDEELFPLKSLNTPFYFNKTKGVIPPGQLVRLKVWYLPRSGNISTESWKIITEPKLCPSDLIFRFWGYAEKSSLQTLNVPLAVDLIDGYLDENIRKRIIREILNEIVEGPRQFEGTQCTCHSTDAEIFRCKNPAIHYYPDLVIGCRRLYRDATLKHGPLWNLSLRFLKQTILRIQDLEERERMLARFDELRKRRTTRGQSLKYQKVYNALCDFFDSFDSEDRQAKVASALKESMIIICEMEEKELTALSQTSLRSKTSSGRRRRSLSTHSRSSPKFEPQQMFEFDYQLHREMFFDRIRDSLKETIDEICDIILATNVNFRLNLSSDNYENCNELLFL